MTVTIWDTTANAGSGGIARVATVVHTPDPEDPEGPGTSETTYGPYLSRVSESRWVRPQWSDAMKAAPHLHAPCFVEGWVILRDKLVTPSLAAGEDRGALGASPVVDLEAGTATWTYAVVTKSLAVRKAAMIAAIKDKALGLSGIISEGFVYALPGSPADPHTYQIGLNDQGNMTSIGGLFALGVVDAHGGFWRDASNVNVTMTQAECTAFFEAAAAYKSAIVRRMWALITAVGDAADTDALALINVAAGSIDGSGAWPANG